MVKSLLLQEICDKIKIDNILSEKEVKKCDSLYKIKIDNILSKIAENHKK